ncbi:hypothetical protein [Sphingobium sp. HDIP04]|uniref:hypothetical protein n=1 Tax=Sphingobium sp. HDIP04 TaxID=428994 RepID=UPI0004061904|nr:hypothetical protein [Sphingobium sp. HDIP04]
MNATAWLHDTRVPGFACLIPVQFIPVDALRVAPGIDNPACTPGNAAAGADGTHGAGRSQLSLSHHGPAFAGLEQ